jgi:hypothetical protein
MKVARQALMVARIESGEGTPEQKSWVRAWDRLQSRLSALDSKTSVLLRFNAIIVAALAYLFVISGTDLVLGTNPTIKMLGKVVGHASLLAAVVSCGFAFPVINVEWEFFGGRLDRSAEGEPNFDEAALQRLGELVARRTLLYSWAWRLAVAGGIGFAILVGVATLHG